MTEHEHTTTTLIIAEIPILQDQFGRYNLNLLFQASAAPENKRPGHWLKRKTSQALIHELDSQMSFSTIDVVKGGNAAGTYVHELLAISYAGWISPAFQLKVNQAFLDMRHLHEIPTPRIPVVRDPAIQMLIEMAVHLDEARTLAEEAKTEAAHASANADRALRNQLFFTIAEYVYVNSLQAQLPTSAYRACSDYLRVYCMDNAIPFRKTTVGGKSWDTEYSFLVNVYTEALPGWLKRRFAQTHLRVLEGPTSGSGTEEV